MGFDHWWIKWSDFLRSRKYIFIGKFIFVQSNVMFPFLVAISQWWVIFEWTIALKTCPKVLLPSRYLPSYTGVFHFWRRRSADIKEKLKLDEKEIRTANARGWKKSKRSNFIQLMEDLKEKYNRKIWINEIKEETLEGLNRLRKLLRTNRRGVSSFSTVLEHSSKLDCWKLQVNNIWRAIYPYVYITNS